MTEEFPSKPPRKWRLRDQVPPHIAQEIGMPTLWAQLLYNRGIYTKSQAKEFLEETPQTPSDPFLLPGMQTVVERVTRALRSGETISIFGDFDADGVTATAILYRAISQMGGKVYPYIPHRVKEGHGLSTGAVQHLQSQGVSIIVTVDCGITSFDQVQEALSMGIDTIITDHHLPLQTLPKAYAIINPKLAGSPASYSHLTGAGVALQLAQALYSAQGKTMDETPYQLAAIGTVADAAPLLGENRLLVKRGLKSLNSSPSTGLRQLLIRAGAGSYTLDTDSISFIIAPRINADGRMADASTSFQLLTATSETTAASLADKLERMNLQRQQLVAALLPKAMEIAKEQASTHQALLWIEGQEYPPGIIGLIASRFAEEFHRPTFVVSLDEHTARGSGRGIPEIDLVASLNECASLFTGYGGHRRAAGFTTNREHLSTVRKRLLALVQERLQGLELTPITEIDAAVNFRELLGDSFKFAQALSPFGVSNPEPLFLTRGVEVAKLSYMGAQGGHLRLKLKQDRATWDAIAFHQAAAWDSSQTYLDVVYSMGKNRFEDETVKLFLRDFRPYRPD